MGLLTSLTALLGVEVKSTLEQVKRSVVALVVIALFSSIAFTFLLIAAFISLTYWQGPLWAPLATATGSALIAIGFWAILRIIYSRARRIQAKQRRSNKTTAPVTTAALTALPMLVKSPLARNLGLPLVGILTLALSNGNSAKKS